MKYTLPNLNPIFCLLWVASAAAQTPALPANSTQSPQTPQTSQSLLQESASLLTRTGDFKAEFRHRVQLTSQPIVGKGVYRQSVVRDKRRYRLDISLRAAEQLSTFQQASNGRFLWTRRSFPNQRNFTRLDLLEVKKAGIDVDSTEGALAPIMGAGGLPSVLRGIASRFDFAPPKKVAVAGQPAWILEGVWKRDHLARLAPSIPADGSQVELGKLPKRFPTHVIIVLNQSRAWPLFPQLIEYRRAQARLDEPTSEAEPLITMEFFNVVSNVHFADREFEIQASDEERDITTEFIEQHVESSNSGD